MLTGLSGSVPERQAEVKPTNKCCVCCSLKALTCAGVQAWAIVACVIVWSHACLLGDKHDFVRVLGE